MINLIVKLIVNIDIIFNASNKALQKKSSALNVQVKNLIHLKSSVNYVNKNIPVIQLTKKI
jgi:hypothetical protein